MNYMDILKNNKQEHILKYIDMANEEQKKHLIEQIESINFENLKLLYDKANKLTENNGKKSDNIGQISYLDKSKLAKNDREELEALGEEIIKNGHYAVVTMAGGQGTRLGHHGPKGTFMLDIKPNKKSLFEILLDNIKKANEKYNVVINWYIMTSDENNKETIEFFEKNNYFGYPKSKIKFFTQGNLPLIREDGKLLVTKEMKIKEAADGNGCIYHTMKNKDILADMRKNGITWMFAGPIENPLVKMCDPLLLGLTIKENNLIGAKSIVKVGPTERVGVFCKRNSKPSVIEYSELTKEMSEMRDEEDELIFGEANINCTVFNIEAIEKIASKELPYHRAHKKAAYMDEEGNYIEVTEPNAFKYETFIFDGFSYFDDMTVLRVKREEEFAPIKNKEGVDSPETAIELYNNYYKSL